MPRKVYTAKNGARYVKLANGQCRFISGASKRYLNRIRKMRGGNPAAAAGAGAGADAGADDVIVIGDYEVKIVGVTEEKGNLTPRLIILVKLNNPYIAYNGSIQEWFPFYLSSGHYSKGQSGMAQPFSGMIIQDFLQQGDPFFAYLRSILPPQIVAKLRYGSKNELLIKLTAGSQHYIKCNLLENNVNPYSLEIAYNDIINLDNSDEELDHTNAKNLFKNYYTANQLFATLNPRPNDPFYKKICFPEFLDIRNNISNKIKIVKHGDGYQLQNEDNEIIIDALPLLNPSEMLDILGNNNMFGINLNEVKGHFLNKEILGEINEYLISGDNPDLEYHKEILEQYIQFINEAMEVPSIHDIVSYLLDNTTPITDEMIERVGRLENIPSKYLKQKGKTIIKKIYSVYRDISEEKYIDEEEDDYGYGW